MCYIDLIKAGKNVVRTGKLNPLYVHWADKVYRSWCSLHLTAAELDNPHQSAYKRGHSTETTLLAIQNDTFLAMDKGKVTALVLLDLSAAFDTIDHTLLLNRLTQWYGFEGSSLNWFSSYLSNRTQSIKVQGVVSDGKILRYGVPQGSVLGPLLFSLYTLPLSHLIGNFPVIHKLYADDTQIYLSFTTDSCKASIVSLQNCLSAVQDWMFENKLKLNPEKTEFMLIGTRTQRNKFKDIFPIQLMGNNVSPASSARNLGVVFEEDFSLKKHVNNLCKNCNYHIRDFKRIRKHLDTPTATCLANALVSSRLDYCNSLFPILTEEYLSKLQRVQNSLARTVTNSRLIKSPDCTSSISLLNKLHWLPIRSRIAFKINLITYKALNSGIPVYLKEILMPRTYNISLRVNETSMLKKGPRVHSRSGSASFSVSAPHFWNQLPSHIHESSSVASFRKSLKTQYFSTPPNFRPSSTIQKVPPRLPP